EGFGGVGQGIREDHAALGVGVGDLGGAAAEVAGDITGAVGGAGHVVLRGRDQTGQADAEAEPGGGDDGRDHGGAAGHVGTHQVHALGGLDRDPAGVERDALADQD